MITYIICIFLFFKWKGCCLFSNWISSISWLFWTLWMTSDFWRIALSSLIARILSTIVNYVINKKYVFKGKNNSKQTARRFLILTIVITILSTLFVYAASSLHIMSEKLAKPIGDLLLFLLSYSAQTKWVFKNNESKNHLKWWFFLFLYNFFIKKHW